MFVEERNEAKTISYVWKQWQQMLECLSTINLKKHDEGEKQEQFFSIEIDKNVFWFNSEMLAAEPEGGWGIRDWSFEPSAIQGCLRQCASLTSLLQTTEAQCQSIFQ